AITAVLIGMVVFLSYGQLVQTQREVAIKRDIASRAALLERAFDEVTHDVRLVASLPAMRAVCGDDASSDASASRAEMASIGLSMLRAKPHYLQVRIFDGTVEGREVVRVARQGGEIRREDEARLQLKGHRDYYREALAAPAGKVSYSQVGLNREFGSIEVPHSPVVRASLRVERLDGSPAGIVTINVDFPALLGELLPEDTALLTYYVANEQGDYLWHPDDSREYGFDLGRPYRVQDDFPGMAAVFGPAGAESRVECEGARGCELVVFRRVPTFPEQPERFLVLGTMSTGGDVEASAAAIRARGLGSTAVVLLLGAAVAGVFAAALITRPLRGITEAADRVASGEDASLPVERRDEIGVLARAMDRMLGALRREERRLADVNIRLRAANEDLEHFAHIASHDLREPVSRVASLSDLALQIEADRLSEQSREVLTCLRDSSAQMVDLIRDFRSLTRIDRDDVVRAEVDLAEVVGAVVAEYRDRLDRREVRVEVEAQPRLALYVNLTRALYRNLVQNALDHGPERGMVLRFTASASEGDEGVWVLGVWNSGSTIPAGELERVFAPFRGGRGKRAEGEENSGLGLSICRRIVERHAGRIWAESGADFVHLKFMLGGRGDDADVC
ncbi:MAG: sensor histidine kinase, partial [Phycisphaerales bacterium]|nr:sensor histidine kinase [Phycisphaerales bacterium]